MHFASPVSDPGFTTHKAHGVEAQLATLNTVVRMCLQHRTAVDVGAHIGTWSCELAVRFGNVHAFEPEPENFACLERNTPLAVQLHNVALGDTGAGAKLVQHGSNSGCWRIAEGLGVEVYTLDDYALRNVDLIKIDVEGYEGRVLLGATNTLIESSPVVIFEDNALGEKLYGADWVDPKPILADLGYHFRKRLHKDEIWSRA